MHNSFRMFHSFRMFRVGGLLCAGVALTANIASADAPKPAVDVGGPDATFIKKAGQGGIAEVELSKIAEQKAKSSEVRNFAEHMVRDHTANNRELAQIASSQNIALPQYMDDEHSALRDKLSSLDDASFDKVYVDAMRTDHQKMDDLLKTSSVTNDDLRAFIRKTTPVVEEHLREANQLKE